MRAAAFYAGAGWLLVEGAAQVFPFFEIPNWIVRWIVIVVLLGFVPVLVFSWFFEVTTRGLRVEVALARPAPTMELAAPSETKGKTYGFITLGIGAVAVAALLIGLGLQLVGKDSTPARADLNSRRTIAVLPFSTFSNGDGDNLLAAGLQDAVLTSLAGVQGLKVISRTSVMQFKDPQNRSLKDIAKQLGVGAVIEGSLQRVGLRILVQAQLVDANTDEHIWAHAYDLKIDDLLTVEVDLSQQVASAVKVQLSSSERVALGQTIATKPETYAAYVRAQGIMDDDLSAKGLGEAEALLQKAIKDDPSFALAYYGLSRCYLYRYFSGLDVSENTLNLARQALLYAQKLNPNLPELHIGWGRYYFIGRHELATAEIEFRKAVDLIPNSAESTNALGQILQRRARLSEAIIFQRRSIELNPLSISSYRSLSATFQLLQDYDTALAIVQKGLALSPNDADLLMQKASLEILGGNIAAAKSDLALVHDPSPSALATIAFNEGNVPEAIRELKRETDFDPSRFGEENSSIPPVLEIGLLTLAWEGIRAARPSLTRAIGELQQVKTLESGGPPERATSLAMAYAGLGERDKAEEQLMLLKQYPSVEDPTRRGGIVYDELLAELLLNHWTLAAALMDQLLEKPSVASTASLRHDPLLKKFCNVNACKRIAMP